jgi:CheY-like chemotaxis protein
MSTTLKILLIEDDADDIELLEEAFKINHVAYELQVIMEGDKVAPYITQNRNSPEVIVLDFNLPRVHGREILKMIKSSPDFKNIPLVVLTTSAAKEDIEYSLNLGADHFITKPTSLEGFADTVAVISGAKKKKK